MHCFAETLQSYVKILFLQGLSALWVQILPPLPTLEKRNSRFFWGLRFLFLRPPSVGAALSYQSPITGAAGARPCRLTSVAIRGLPSLG